MTSKHAHTCVDMFEESPRELTILLLYFLSCEATRTLRRAGLDGAPPTARPSQIASARLGTAKITFSRPNPFPFFFALYIICHEHVANRRSFPNSCRAMRRKAVLSSDITTELFFFITSMSGDSFSPSFITSNNALYKPPCSESSVDSAKAQFVSDSLFVSTSATTLPNTPR